MRNCQVNLASEWGWGRNVRVTSRVAFCVLGMSNSYRRTTRKGYKQTGLCMFSSGGVALENEGGISLLLCALLSCLIFVCVCEGHSCVKKWTGIQSLWKISVLAEIIFAGSEVDFCCCCCCLFSVSFFPIDLENIYDTKLLRETKI